jgi:hypothetical protein
MTGVVVGEGMEVGSVVAVGRTVGVLLVHAVAKTNTEITIRKNPDRCAMINLQA